MSVMVAKLNNGKHRAACRECPWRSATGEESEVRVAAEEHDARHTRRKAKNDYVKRPPCTCDRYPFPHRRSWQCDEHTRPSESDRCTSENDRSPSENDRYLNEQHRRDLESWAALSRG